MKLLRIVTLTIGTFALAGTANATIINIAVGFDVATVEGSLGVSLTSLTGPLPDSGGVVQPVTVGDATLQATGGMFIGSGWSSLLPGGNAIAISGLENLTVSLDSGPSTAFGYWFHEPGSFEGVLDGCNTTCVPSTFSVEFFLGAVLQDTFFISHGDDVALFVGALLDNPFDSVAFTEISGTDDNEFYGEMFVRGEDVAPIPEPSTLLLLGTGLLGAGVMARRRRKQ